MSEEIKAYRQNYLRGFRKSGFGREKDMESPASGYQSKNVGWKMARVPA